jgi:type II secretory pathway pseudopilin PulG
MDARRNAFTLLDLMMSVAILGILLSLVLPRIQEAKARANQLTMKAELAQVLQAEKTFRELYKTYQGDAPTAGFVRKGLSLTTAGMPPKTGTSFRYNLYGWATTTGTAPTTLAALGITQLYGTWANDFYATTALCPVVAIAGVTPQSMEGALGIAPTTHVNKTDFTIGAAGCPTKKHTDSTAPGPLDYWTIDQDAVIKQWHPPSSL